MARTRQGKQKSPSPTTQEKCIRATKWLFDYSPNRRFQSVAAKCFRIPPSTLNNWIKGKTSKLLPRHAHANQQNLLPEEEEKIVEWVLWLSDRGFPVTPRQLNEAANTILQRRKPGKTVGDHWYLRFLRRHERLDSQWCRCLDRLRARAREGKRNYKHFYDLVRAVLLVPLIESDFSYSSKTTSSDMGHADILTVKTRRLTASSASIMPVISGTWMRRVASWGFVVKRSTLCVLVPTLLQFKVSSHGLIVLECLLT
jgi:hypothetical protein